MFQIDVNAVNDRNPYMWKKRMVIQQTAGKRVKIAK